MLKNYCRIAWRNLVKNKAYTFINVFGLGLSMACGILIFTLVQYHLSFDNFHKNPGRIYRFVTEQHRDVVSYAESVPPALAKAFRTDYTFDEATANVVNFGNDFVTIDAGNEVKKFKEPEGLSFAEAAYFDIFNFPLITGNIKTALNEPNTAVITQRIAEKYFGTENPVNKIIKFENRVPLKITGVLKNLPPNTLEKAEIFVSYITLKSFDAFFVDDHAWGGISGNLRCYTRLKPGVNPTYVESLLPAYVKKFRAKSRNVHHYVLQPLSEVHFDARYGGQMEKRNLWILAFIGIFIIITASVNFVNLATAQALRRSREIGVRKVLGSMRSQLFWQFIAETAIITLLGVVLAFGIATTLLPYVNTLFKSAMVINPATNIALLLFTLALAVVVTFLAGSYPGLILARFKPVAALKGKISNQNIGGFNTRRGLIIVQFAISQMLIIGMIVIAAQMRYAKTADMGFDKDAIIMVPTGVDTTGTSIKTFKAQVMQIAGVQNASVCRDAPATTSTWNTLFKYDNRAEDESFSLSVKEADDRFIPTFGLEMAAGRNLQPSDTLREFVVNEAFVRKLNLKSADAVIGKWLIMGGGGMKAPIVGVVKDFHDKSFHSEINPVALASYGGDQSNFAVKINLNNAKTVLPAIEKAWNTIYPNQVYEYHFVDDKVAEFYNAEQTMLTLVQAFSLIAIFIGCLGLYGLVMFMAAQRTKEIGIRKVLGGSIAHILWLFGKEFSRLIIIAFVIAAPVAGWLMSNWLKDFQFRIPLSPLIFMATILLMFVIAAVTVGYQATRAALMNPVKSLKTE